jgi:hypothetical protein
MNNNNNNNNNIHATGTVLIFRNPAVFMPSSEGKFDGG